MAVAITMSNLKNLFNTPEGSVSIAKVATFSILLSVAILLFLGNKLSWFADNKTDQTIVKAVQKYESVKQSNNSKISICVQADVVASAYLKVNDLAKQAEWEAIKEKDCEAAGVPSY
ncbi:hypothetical protein [Leptothoe spongobia]|uniref:Uncharacterized protein n=1 Tax=Leptothoe spongobia TAU-MAC 1115 TaxID=1967444 RepID=A0A947DAW1_9CYAN|nr:hypothetical protein [Leptothoe spongobia]MBT9314040.1 hypothetical protein [Leptothoe spongobia TAU-MAC 1115]